MTFSIPQFDDYISDMDFTADDASTKAERIEVLKQIHQQEADDALDNCAPDLHGQIMDIFRETAHQDRPAPPITRASSLKATLERRYFCIDGIIFDKSGRNKADNTRRNGRKTSGQKKLEREARAAKSAQLAALRGS